MGDATCGFCHSTPPRHYVALSPSRGRKVQRDHFLFPLEGKCRAAAKGCTRLRVEMKRKGCPDRQTAACLGGVSFEVLAVQHPRATSWPSPPQGGARGSGTLCSHRLKKTQGSEAFFPRVKSQPVLQDAVNIFLYLNEMKRNVTTGVANHKNS